MCVVVRDKHSNYSYHFETNFRSCINYEPQLRNISSDWIEVILHTKPRKRPFLLTTSVIAGLPRARQSPIPIDYGQPLFLWLSRDWPSVRTYASTDCTGGVGDTIKKKGGVSQACLAKSTSFTLDIHNMVNWQLSKQDSHWPVAHDHIAGSCINSSRWRDLFGSCPLTS